MDALQSKVYEIVKNHRKKRDYSVGDPSITIDDPLLTIWFSEILREVHPDYDPKTDLEKGRAVKRALVELEKSKKIIYCMSEPPFYILYEDRDKLRNYK